MAPRVVSKAGTVTRGHRPRRRKGTELADRNGLSPRLENALLTLRIFGPGLNIELARKANRSGPCFHRAVYELRQRGLAEATRAGYDVTELGRQLADRIIAGRSRRRSLFE